MLPIVQSRNVIYHWYTSQLAFSACIASWLCSCAQIWGWGCVNTIAAVDVVVMRCEWIQMFGVGWCLREQYTMLQMLSVASLQGMLAAWASWLHVCVGVEETQIYIVCRWERRLVWDGLDAVFRGLLTRYFLASERRNRSKITDR